MPPLSALAPRPASARPMTKALELGAKVQRREPDSKMRMAVMKTVLMEKMV